MLGFPAAVANTINPTTHVLDLIKGVLMEGSGNKGVLVGHANSTDLQFTFVPRGGSQLDTIEGQVFGHVLLKAECFDPVYHDKAVPSG